MSLYYFLGTSDSDWNNSDNWYWDSSGNQSAGGLPGEYDDVHILSTCDGNSGSSPVYITNLTIENGNFVVDTNVSGLCTIQNGGYFGDGATINGNVNVGYDGFIGMGSLSYINGIVSFTYNGSTNYAGTNITGNVYFESNWTGTADDGLSVTGGNVIYYYGYTGTVSNLSCTGNIYYANYPTLYYNGASDYNWNNIDNWWVDENCSQKSYNTPTSSDDVVVVNGSTVSSNSGSEPTINNISLTGNGTCILAINITVTGLATFEYAGTLASATLTGNAVFNYDAINQGVIYGDVQFNSGAYNGDGSNQSGTVNGIVTFDNATNSSNGTVNVPSGESCTFDNGANNAGTVVGTTYFNGSSGSSFNNGTVTGDAYFSGGSLNNTGTITGDASFVDSCTNYGYINGTATFNDESYSDGGSLAYAIFNDNSYNKSIVNYATFNDNSENKNNGYVNYSADFKDNSINNGYINGWTTIHYPINRNTFVNSGTYSGFGFSGYPTFYYYSGSWYIDSNHSEAAPYTPGYYDDVVIDSEYYFSDVTFNNATINAAISTSYNTFTVNGTITFENGNMGTAVSSAVVVANTAVFNNSTNLSSNSYLTVSNYAEFNDYSSTNGNINGNVYFRENSALSSGYIDGNIFVYDSSTIDPSATVTGYAEVNSPHPVISSGNISGGVNYVGYISRTVYFYNSYIGPAGLNWNDINNWWDDENHTTQAAYVPDGYSNPEKDDVIIQSSVLSNTLNNEAVVKSLIVDSCLLGISITVEDSAHFIGSAEYNGNMQISSTNGTITFSDTSSLTSGSVTTQTGPVVFEDNSYVTMGTVTSNSGSVDIYYPVNLPLGGTLSGGPFGDSINYYNYPSRNLYFYGNGDWSDLNNWWEDSIHATQAAYLPFPDAALDNVTVDSSISNNMNSSPTTIGSLTVNSSNYISIPITCTYATFNDTSSLAYETVLNQSQNPGDTSISFNDLSSNSGTINAATPPVVFQDGSSNTSFGTINGNVSIYSPVSLPFGGTVNGTIAYYGYPYYFNDGVNANNNGDWGTVNNWFIDSIGTIPAGGVPTSTYPGENVILQSNVTIDSSATSTAYNLSCEADWLNISGIAVTVNGLATFANGGFLASGGTISGNAEFKNGSYNQGNIAGNALFQGSSTNRDGTVTGTTTFDLSSVAAMLNGNHNGTYGSVEFKYEKGVNGSSILGLV